jgi:hypothetical protein
MKLFRFTACLLLLLFASPLAARADSTDELQPFCLVLASDEIATTWAAVDRLAARGCADLMSHGAGVIEGRATPAVGRRLESVGGVQRVFLAPADDAELQSLSDAARMRVSVWNAALAAEAAHSKIDPAAEEATASLSADACVLLPPVAHDPGPAKAGSSSRDIPRMPKYNKAWGAQDYQTSEFLVGRVAVGIVTPHVRGGAQWTPQALEDAAAASRNAMYFWKARASQWSDYPVYLAFEYLESLETDTSPLVASNDTRWVSPLMTSARQRLGITAPPPGKSQIPDQTFADVYQVVNFMRTKWHADWGILIVVGLGDRFTEQPGLGAYAYLGGPFLVAPNKPGNWGLEGLLIHESGHLFFALDEYCCGGTSSPCTAVSGYLAVSNRNSRNRAFGGCWPTSQSCAMATPGRNSCNFTEEMMGIKDSNGDGIRDILQTQPIVEIFQRDGLEMLDSLGRRALSDTITTLTPSFSGVVRDAPLPNKVVVSGVGAGESAAFPADAEGFEPAAGDRAPITMNTLASAEYRIADIDTNWQWIRPDSSGYDCAVEDFRVFISGLSGGTHTVEFRGTNSTGKSTEKNATTKHRLVVLAVALDSLAITNQLGGGFDVTWAVRGESWGSSAKLWRSEDGRPEELLTTVPLRSDARFAIADKSVRPGHRYSYRVETEAFGKTYSLSSEGTASVPIRDAADRLSSATPNPFYDQTFLSYVVPEGILGPRPPKDGGNKPGPPPELPTSPHGEMGTAAEAEAAVERARLPVEVNVTIHDVTGRVVRHLVGGYVPGARIYTTRWDGHDDDGQRLPAGVYFSRLQAGQFIDSNKLVLMK